MIHSCIIFLYFIPSAGAHTPCERDVPSTEARWENGKNKSKNKTELFDSDTIITNKLAVIFDEEKANFDKEVRLDALVLGNKEYFDAGRGLDSSVITKGDDEDTVITNCNVVVGLESIPSPVELSDSPEEKPIPDQDLETTHEEVISISVAVTTEETDDENNSANHIEEEVNSIDENGVASTNVLNVREISKEPKTISKSEAERSLFPNVLEAVKTINARNTPQNDQVIFLYE